MSNNKKPEAADIHIGARVKERRTSARMSQEDLGEHLGITFQQIQKYEKGANRIGAGRLFNISQVLKTPVGYFFEGLKGEMRDGRSGFAEGEGQPPVAGAPGGREDVSRLARDFVRISDPAVRSRILDLLQALATEGSSEAGARSRR